MNTRRYLACFGLAVALSTSSLTGMAGEGDLCAPFKNNGKVDQSVLATMLEAAEVGRLYRIEASFSKRADLWDRFILEDCNGSGYHHYYHDVDYLQWNETSRQRPCPNDICARCI